MRKGRSTERGDPAEIPVNITISEALGPGRRKAAYPKHPVKYIHTLETASREA